MGAYVAFDGGLLELDKRVAVPERCVKKPEPKLVADNKQLAYAA